MPYESWERPSCTWCGGALGYDAERCTCGGRSARYETQRADPAPEEDPPERRTLSWEDAYRALWARYAPE
jgi:hypothetical protein